MPTLDDYAREWGALTIEETGGLIAGSETSPAVSPGPRRGSLATCSASLVFNLYVVAQVIELRSYLAANVGNVPVPFTWPGDEAPSKVRIASYGLRNTRALPTAVTVQITAWNGA